jgi:hypothetical protein
MFSSLQYIVDVDILRYRWEGTVEFSAKNDQTRRRSFSELLNGQEFDRIVSVSAFVNRENADNSSVRSQ